MDSFPTLGPLVFQSLWMVDNSYFIICVEYRQDYRQRHDANCVNANSVNANDP